MAEKTNHFVLVHGICDGAWCWYRLIPLLKSAGHRVTALDLRGCGADPTRPEQITSFYEYVKPLMEFMESLPPHEKVVLVGHSYGGLGISLAMECFPERILIAIYVTAFVPNSASPPANLVQEFFKRTPMESLMDFQVTFDHGPENPPTSVFFGPKYMAAKVYHFCKTEDLELAKMMVRPSGLFLEDLATENFVTEEKFGSTRRVFIVCEKDGIFEEDFQRWLIENSKTKEVELILGADHMPMLSKPQELCLCLLQIAEKHC